MMTGIRLVALGLAAAVAAPVLAMAQPAAGPPPPPKGWVPKVPTAADWAALAKLPDWTGGVWQVDWAALFGAGGRPTPPNLTPEYQAKFDAFQAAKKTGQNLQNQNANCIPPGMPQIMTMPYPIEFLYTPGQVTITIETDSQVRRIYTDGRPHPEDPDQTFNGDSIGHWENGTLVVDTVSLNPTTTLAEGVPHSDGAKIVERIKSLDADHLEIETTITDPAVLKSAWTVKRPYIRHRDWVIQEYVCEQNNHDSAGPNGEAGFRTGTDDAPPAPAPKS